MAKNEFGVDIPGIPDAYGAPPTGETLPAGSAGIRGILGAIWATLASIFTVKAKVFTVTVTLVRPANATVYAIGATNLINSGPVISCDEATNTTLTAHSGSTLLGVYPGMAVTGTGIDANTLVVSVAADLLTCVLNKPTTATATNTITFTATAVLPCLDFSVAPYFGVEGQEIEFRAAILTSSYGAAATKLAAQIALYKTTAMQANQADGQSFAPAFATVGANKTGRFDDVSVSVGLGTNCYEIMQSDVGRFAKLGVGGKLYAAVLANNIYTPVSGEIIIGTFKGIMH